MLWKSPRKQGQNCLFRLFWQRFSPNNKNFAQKVVPFADGKEWLMRV
jgi:hypothetical protein